jgi:hypothetical protein
VYTELLLTALLYALRILIPFKLARTSPLSSALISQRMGRKQKHQLLHYLGLFWRMRTGIRPDRICWISVYSQNNRRLQINSTLRAQERIKLLSVSHASHAEATEKRQYVINICTIGRRGYREKAIRDQYLYNRPERLRRKGNAWSIFVQSAGETTEKRQ